MNTQTSSGDKEILKSIRLLESFAQHKLAVIHYPIPPLHIAFPDNVHVSHCISQTALKLGGYGINEFTLGHSCSVLTTSAAAPRGPSRWTARPAAPPAGCPGCSARSTAATRGTARLAPTCRGRGGSPGRGPTFLLTPSDKAFTGRFCWSCSVSAPSNLQDTVSHSGFLTARGAGGRTGPHGATRGRAGSRAQKCGSEHEHQAIRKSTWFDRSPKMVFPFTRK